MLVGFACRIKWWTTYEARNLRKNISPLHSKSEALIWKIAYIIDIRMTTIAFSTEYSEFTQKNFPTSLKIESIDLDNDLYDQSPEDDNSLLNRLVRTCENHIYLLWMACLSTHVNEFVKMRDAFFYSLFLIFS